MEARLDRAVAAFDIAPFARVAGGRKESLSAHSHEWLFTCPNCGSSRLRFNAAKRTGMCWGCNRGYDTFRLVRDILKLDEFGAVEWFLAHYVGGDSTAGSLSSALAALAPPKPAVRRLPPMPWPDGAEILTSPCAPHASAWTYLAFRQITEEMVREFGLGYGRSGRVQNRIIFPVRMDGTLVYWQARACWDPPIHLEGKALREWKERTGYVKSINATVVGDCAQGHEVIFNYERASVEPHVVICEGPVDAINVGTHAVALLGKAGGPVKIERLKRMRASRFTLYLDRGADERASASAIAAELAATSEVYVCEPPEGYDAGALPRAMNAAIVAGATRWTPKI